VITGPALGRTSDRSGAGRRSAVALLTPADPARGASTACLGADCTGAGGNGTAAWLGAATFSAGVGNWLAA
jgi:hypothetical protein